MTTLVKVGGGSTSQSDYAQNDSTKADYIKNRPCWSESTSVEHESYVLIATQENTLLEGFAPDLSERVGETLAVPTYYREVGEEDWDSFGALECEIVEIESGIYGFAVPELEGMSVGVFLARYNYETQSADENNSTFEFNPELISYGVEMKFEIPIPYTNVETTWHKLDTNYIDVDALSKEIETGESVTEIYIEPTLFVNQPTWDSSIEDYQIINYFNGYGSGILRRYFVYITDENSGEFMLVPSLTDLANKIYFDYTPTNDDVVFTLADLDTGLGYAVFNGLDVIVNLEGSSGDLDKFEVFSYSNEDLVPNNRYDKYTLMFRVGSQNIKDIDTLSVDLYGIQDIGYQYDTLTSPTEITLRCVPSVKLNTNSTGNGSSFIVYSNPNNTVTSVSGTQEVVKFCMPPYLKFNYDTEPISVTPLKKYRGIWDFNYGGRKATLPSRISYHLHSESKYFDDSIYTNSELSCSYVDELIISDVDSDQINLDYDYAVNRSNTTYWNISDELISAQSSSFTPNPVDEIRIEYASELSSLYFNEEGRNYPIPIGVGTKLVVRVKYKK